MKFDHKKYKFDPKEDKIVDIMIIKKKIELIELLAFLSLDYIIYLSQRLIYSNLICVPTCTHVRMCTCMHACLSQQKIVRNICQ